MSSSPYHIGLMSDFNVQNLEVLLRKARSASAASCTQGPYGQTVSLLLDSKADFWSQTMDAVVVWTVPQTVAPSFRRVLAGEDFSVDALLADVDAFAALLKNAPAKARTVVVPSW